MLLDSHSNLYFAIFAQKLSFTVAKQNAFKALLIWGILDFSYCDFTTLHTDGIELIHSEKKLSNQSPSHQHL